MSEEITTKATHGHHLCSACGEYISKDDVVIVGVIHADCHKILKKRIKELEDLFRNLRFYSCSACEENQKIQRQALKGE